MIIAVDLDGTLISTKPADISHQEWFNIMSYLLKDESVKDMAGHKNYFPYVYECMQRYTGLVKDSDKELLRKMARNVFQLSYIGMCNKMKDSFVFKDFKEYLIGLKEQGHEVFLVTGAPEDGVKPILEIAESEELFDEIYTCSLLNEPDKKEILESFIKEKGKPACYIGNGDEDVTAANDLGVVSVLAAWDAKCDDPVRKQAKYVVADIVELDKAMQEILQ